MPKFIFLAAVATFVSSSAFAADVSKAIQYVSEFGEIDFAPSTSRELYVEYDGLGYTVTFDRGALTVATTLKSCIRYNASLVVFVTDSDANGVVEYVTYGLDKWKCDGSSEYITSLPQSVLQDIYDSGVDAVNAKFQ